MRGAGADEVTLDFDVRWCGDPTVVLDVVVMGLTLQVKLQELQLLGPLRVVLSSFDDKLPCFHLMKFAFVDQPRVDFALSLVGDIEMIPGLKETVTEVIGKGLSKAMVWPKFVKVPIANKNEKPGVSRSDAGAVLEVTLVRGNGLKNARTFGKSDPFVTTRVTGSQRAAAKSSVVVGSLNPHWNETFRLIVDDPSTQSVSLAVCDYSPFAEDAGVKRFGRFMSKLNGACLGWTRSVRRRVYNIGGVRKSYAKGDKLERAGTEKEDADGSLFQSTMGTGRINLASLKPFQIVARRVVLTKSASSILGDPRGSYARNDPRRRRKNLDAGTLDLRVRLVPLSADAKRTQDALRRPGAAARDLTARCAEKGVVDKKSFIKKYLEKLDPNESPEARPPRAAKEAAKRVAEDVDHLVSSVLGGELDGVPDAKGKKGGKLARSDSLTAADMRRLAPHLNGLLHVTLVRGESLVAMDATTGSSDPYFKLKLKTQKWKPPAHQTLNPTYDAAAAFFVPRGPAGARCRAQAGVLGRGHRGQGLHGRGGGAPTSRRRQGAAGARRRGVRARRAQGRPVRRRALQVQVPAGGRRGVPRGGGRVRRGRRGRGVRSRGDPRDAAVDTTVPRSVARSKRARVIFITHVAS